MSSGKGASAALRVHDKEVGHIQLQEVQQEVFGSLLLQVTGSNRLQEFQQKLVVMGISEPGRWNKDTDGRGTVLFAYCFTPLVISFGEQCFQSRNHPGSEMSVAMRQTSHLHMGVGRNALCHLPPFPPYISTTDWLAIHKCCQYNFNSPLTSCILV